MGKDVIEVPVVRSGRRRKHVGPIVGEDNTELGTTPTLCIP
jgi:hypothetical protein